MPELPEVETIRRQLEPRLTGRQVIDASSHSSDKFTPAVEIVGARFTGADRRGKFLLLGLDDGRELIVHLGMTGQLLPEVARDAPHVRAWWRLDDTSTMAFKDVRRFGRIRVSVDGVYEGLLARLGPEPFSADFTPDYLFRAVKKSNRHVKTQLLSQRVVAGVGNIYADEACFVAGVHPGARRITHKQAAALHRAIIDALEQGIANGGTTLRDYRNADGAGGTNQLHLDCYGRWGEPCVRCGTELRRTTLDARTTTFCPNCQKR